MDTEGISGENTPKQEKPSGSGGSKTKTCSTCGETKKVSEFHKNRTGKFGVDSRCKVCVKAYYRANRDSIRARSTAWHAANKDRRAAWRAANKDRIAASKAAWCAANPDKVKAKRQRRRARKANAKGDFTAAQWKDRLAYHGYKCVYCGAEKHETPEGWLSCDHMIPLSKGGANWPSNLVPACRSCNCSKGTKTYFEYMESKK